MSLPVGSPWEMLAVDVLEVPVSTNGNRYLLIVQDYFTKWADAFPMPDQTARRITDILINLCARMGLYILIKAMTLKVPSSIKPYKLSASPSRIQRHTIRKVMEWWSV